MRFRHHPDKVFEVEEIVDKRVFVSIQGEYPEYRVKWKDYSEKYNSWEPIVHLEGCDEAISAFESLITEQVNRSIKE